MTMSDPWAKYDTPSSGGGASSSPAPVATTMSGGLRVDSQNSRDKDIAALSESRIQVALKMGILTEGEVDRVKGAGYTARLADNPWGSAENKIQAEWTANPPAFFRSTLDSSESPTQALKGLSTFSGEPYGAGPTVNGAGGYTGSGPTTKSAGGGATGSGSGSGGGGSSAAAAPAAPPPPVPNSLLDLANRGATRVGSNVLLNGQQYRNQTSQVKGPDELWYNVGADGKPQGAGFKSEQAARLAEVYANGGAAIESRFGNSPTAKAAGSGGFQQTVQNPLFPLIGLDQSIAASATKGQQAGDILGTISNNSGNFYDITQGGISAGGGMTPVGNAMNPYDSFTGQMANGDSIGMSSILGNSGVNTAYWLSQMSGLPPSEVAKLNISTPEKALQFQQAVETARAQGMMPNFASLYAMNEPSGYAGASGGSDLKWGSANGGASNTPYDKALSGFANYALGSPDLTYFPDQGYGSTQIGNTVTANSGVDEWGNPLYFANGGQFWTDGMKYLTDAATGRKEAVIGEAGPEKVTIDPVRDVQMGRERNPYMGDQNPMHTMPYGGQHQRPQWNGQMPAFNDLWSRIPQQFSSQLSQWKPQMEQLYGGITQRLGQGGPTPFAAGGTIYAGGNKGFTSSISQPLYTDDGTTTDYGQRLGYKSDPYISSGGGTVNPQTQSVYPTPAVSRSGEPVNASFEFMSAADKERFTNQGGAMPNERISGPLGSTPIGYQPYGDQVLPVYDQLTPANANYDPSMKQYEAGYRYVPMNVGGTPALVRVQNYNTPPGISKKDAATQDAAALVAALRLDPNDPGTKYGSIGTTGLNEAARAALQSGDRNAMLAALYDLDPKQAMLMAAQMGQNGTDGQNGQNGDGQWGGPRQDRNIENEAMRRRQYDIQSRNYSRAGLPSPTLLDIPRQTWGGQGTPPWGSGEAPYQRYGREVQNGYALPFDYEVGSPWFNRSNEGMGGGHWGGHGNGQNGGNQNQNGGQNGGHGGPRPGGWEPGGGTPPWGQPPPGPNPQPGNNWTPWWMQLPEWIRGYQPAGVA